MPSAFAAAPGTQVKLADCTTVAGIVNIPAALIIGILTVMLMLGTKESARVNNIMVALKLIVVLAFILLGVGYIHTANWHPFIPENTGEFGLFGWSGILRGASVVFFAFIGFDAVSTCAQDPIAKGVDAIGLPWFSALIKLGALIGLTTVILVLLYGQSRIFFTMSHDGLLPPMFSRVHPTLQTPYLSQLLIGIIVAVIAALTPIDILGEMVSIGTLFAFVLVCGAIVYLRRSDADVHRPFRVPNVPWLPLLGILFCLLLMAGLPLVTWMRLIVWLIIGLIVYFVYGSRRSRLRHA